MWRIAEGTEVATVRTETSAAIVFTSEAELLVRTPELLGALTRGAEAAGVAWTTHDLAALALPGQKLSIFPNPPTAGAGFYLCLARDHSQHVLAVALECELAGGAGVDPNHPPVEWQVWQGGRRAGRRAKLSTTAPAASTAPANGSCTRRRWPRREFQGLRGYWLRCRLTDAQAGAGGYRVSPEVGAAQVEARGGTVGARHATTVLNEIVGTSDGAPGQRFQLLHAPLLARDPARDQLVSERTAARRWPGARWRISPTPGRRTATSRSTAWTAR